MRWLIWLVPLLVSCGGAWQKVATEVALPVAREALERLAEERGGTQVVAEAICYTLDEQDDEDDPERVLDAVVCIVPRIPE